MEIIIGKFVLKAEYTKTYITKTTTIILMDRDGKVIGNMDSNELGTAIDALVSCRPSR